MPLGRIAGKAANMLAGGGTAPAVICNDCEARNKGRTQRCVKCNMMAINGRQAILCSRCAMGGRGNCASCGRQGATVPARICNMCIPSNAQNVCCRCGNNL